MLKQTCLFFLILMASLTVKAQSPVLDAGIRLQKTINLYSENGIALSYSDKYLSNDRLYFGFSYVTSRLGTAWHSNAIKQDNYLVFAAWYFRKQHVIRPFAKLNTGYFSADYGSPIFNVLPRHSALLSSDFGLSFETGTPVNIATSLGYNFITGNGLSGPGTLYPVFYQLSISYSIFKPFKRQKLKL